MAKTIHASDWEEVTGRDETGAIVNVDYTCPGCGCDTSNRFFVGPDNLHILDSSFETDVTCDICGEKLVVICE